MRVYNNCKVYVGNLTEEATRDEIEQIFSRYGNLRNVFVAKAPPGFALVEFMDKIDAEAAIQALDGTEICGSRAIVEKSHGRSRRFDRELDDGDRCYGRRSGGLRATKRLYSPSDLSARALGDYRHRISFLKRKFTEDRSAFKGQHFEYDVDDRYDDHEENNEETFYQYRQQF